MATALDALHQLAPPHEPYYLAFSGGKDSCVAKHLLQISGCAFDSHYAVTLIDPPELVRFIRRHHPDVAFDKPTETFFHALPKMGFPIRQRRWCCKYLKESHGTNRTIVTGVRAAESNRRARRRTFESCMRRPGTFYMNPLLHWSDHDVWHYIHRHALPYCELYDQGWKRIGCLYCPFTSNRDSLRNAARYPAITQAFIRAFEALYATGRPSMQRWTSGRAMFHWWAFERSNAHRTSKRAPPTRLP